MSDIGYSLKILGALLKLSDEVQGVRLRRAFNFDDFSSDMSIFKYIEQLKYSASFYVVSAL